MLKFRLADRLGKTVSELELQMSDAEFVHWAAYLDLVGKEARRK